MRFAVHPHSCTPAPNALAIATTLMLITGPFALATPPPHGVAPVLTPVNGFAIDGDLFARQPGATTGDWVEAPNLPGTGEGVLGADGMPLNPVTSFHFMDPYNDSSGDFIFTGGDKWADDPNTWGWTTGKPSSKSDINNVLLHLATDASGHTWVIIAADRASTTGDSYIDFELLQNPLVRAANGTFVSSGPHGGRTTNDMVLSLAFTDGGATADFLAWRWVANGKGGFNYVDVTSALPPGGVFVALNTNTVPVPYSAFGEAEYAPNAFVEAAIDLTALLGGFDPCESFGFESIMVKTKASASYSAGIEDLIDPIAYKLRIGPSAGAGPDQIRCADAESTEFPLAGSATSGLTSVASSQWTVVSGTATIDDPSSLVTTARVASASATLRLEVIQANGCADFDEVTLTAVDPPALAITGPTILCPNATAQFSAPAGMDSYSWAVSGNASVVGPSDQQTILVLSSNACDETFELVLTASSNVCTVATAAEVLVNDSVPPILTMPADVTLECPADTRTNATGTATAIDDCGAVTIYFTDSPTNLCGNSQIISRAWIAIDSCGNTTTATQMITVQDTTPPVLSLPPNLTLECPADTQPANTGVATAQDNCGTPTVTHSDLVTDGCGASKTIARTWTAVDECGNSSSLTQTIVVQDTTPPTVTVRNIKVECAGDVPPPYPDLAAFRAAGNTARDNSGPPLTFALINDTGLVGGCPGTVTRVYRVTDECGNFTDRSQTITVDDTIAPTIVCPGPVTAECGDSIDPMALGSATATDNCDTDVLISYTDALVPSSYQIKWYAADPDSNAGPFSPTYLKLAPGSLGCPDTAQLTGRAIDPLRNAVAYASPAGQLDALTSLGGEPMAYGQVVPFEAVIEVWLRYKLHGLLRLCGPGRPWNTRSPLQREGGFVQFHPAQCRNH